MSLLELFCEVDDFWQAFEPHWKQQMLAQGCMKRERKTRLSESEIMTIMILFHQSSYRTFKAFYTEYVQEHLRKAFPELVSYHRFVELKSRVLLPLMTYLRLRCLGECTGISFIDSTPFAVCHKRRIERHKVFGDRGYISQRLFDALFQKDVHLITSLRKNMKNRLLPLYDKLLLRKRSIIETINDQLKNTSQIEHTRHRSVTNFMVNLIAGLIAYCLRPKKPSLHLDTHDLLLSLIPN